MAVRLVRLVVTPIFCPTMYCSKRATNNAVPYESITTVVPLCTVTLTSGHPSYYVAIILKDNLFINASDLVSFTHHQRPPLFCGQILYSPRVAAYKGGLLYMSKF